MLLTLANILSLFISGIKVGSSLLLLNGEKTNENTKLYYKIIIIVIFIQRIPTRTDEHSDSHFVIFYVNACAVCR